MEELREELIEVLRVAIARGEKLGYMDDDYRERLAQLKAAQQMRARDGRKASPYCCCDTDPHAP
jgi:hypothetical protein